MDNNPYNEFSLTFLRMEFRTLERLIKDKHIPLWFVGLVPIHWGIIEKRRNQLRIAILEKEMGL